MPTTKPALDPDIAAAKTDLRLLLDTMPLTPDQCRQLSSAIAKYGAAIARHERARADKQALPSWADLLRPRR